MKTVERDMSSMSAVAVYSNKKKRIEKVDSPRVKKNSKRKLVVEAPEEHMPIDDVGECVENVSSRSDESDEAESLPLPLPSPATEEKILKKRRRVPCGNLISEKCFQWMLSPMPVKKFFEDFWEKRYAYIPRDDECYWVDLFSCRAFDNIIRKNNVQFSKELDVTKYVNGQRETLQLEGRAYPTTVWQHFQDSCTLRLKNPQAYSKKLWQLLSYLQEYFGSFMGANMYLTPPEAQGFAPHYDDIEAFVLQIEGSKHWKLYAPRHENEELPRFSSPDFSQDEVGTPIFEVDLKAGDMLYFPRGMIHQAKTIGDSHSLHLTISTYQKNTWGDLLQSMLPHALEIAMESDVEFRESLPKDYLDFMGFANEDQECAARGAFFEKVQHLCKKLISHLPIDAAADMHAKDFVHNCLPPCFTLKEKKCSLHGNSYTWKQGCVISTGELQLETKIRLIRKRTFRLVCEEGEGSLRLYHTLENSRSEKDTECNFVELEQELEPAIQYLQRSYPDFVRVEDLPLPHKAKLLFANDLYNHGFIMTEVPLPKFFSH